MDCPSCRASAPDGARFCPSCGQALQTASDERRIATVLFADIVGYTGLSETRDPEAVKRLLDGCFEQLVQVINQYGGRVDKILGDAIVALFGAPIAHEDDAERAVRAALQLQDVLGREASGIGVALQLRVGVNTGEVVVGSLRAGGDYTALGDVVNVASRLQTAAAPGQVLVGEHTYAATREVISYENLGQLQARGRDEPVEAWRALRAVAPPGRRPSRVRSPLVGRQHDLTLLGGALASAFQRKRAHLVLLMGEAGVGKSRLSEELGETAREEHGALVLEGRCVPYGEANVWWPIAEILRDAFGVSSTDASDDIVAKTRHLVASAARACTDDELTRLADGLLYLQGVEGALADVDPARAREEAGRAMQQLVEHLARERPLVLTISELHWADDVVLALLERLLDRLRTLPLVIVATARPDLEERWTPKAGRHNLLAVNLEALDRDAASDLLTALLGDELDPSLREVLLDRSGGNPFFLEEMVSLLSDAGVIGARGVAVGPGGRTDLGALPATLRGLVAARLDALPVDERAVLEDAAVMGRAGTADALAAMASSRGQTGAAEVIERLVTKDLLTREDGSVGFRSDLVREVSYETLTKADRARRHAAVADWLTAHARRTEREDELLESIAHHSGAAAELAIEVGAVPGVPDDMVQRALDAVERAAERAEGRETLGLSLRLFDRALRLATGDEHAPVRRRLLVARARVKVTVRDLAGAHADVAAALEAARVASDAQLEACALVVQGDAAQKEGRYDDSVEVLTRAVAVFEELDDTRGLAGALRTLGMTRLFEGEKDAAADLVERSLAAFQEAGDARGEAWALQNLAWIAFDRGDANTADQWLLPSIEKFKEIGDFGGLGWALGLRAWVRFYLGHLDEALELGRYVCGEAIDRGDRWGLAMMKSLVSHALLWKGEVAQAAAEGAEARRAFEGTGDAWGHLQVVFGTARALAMLGRGSEARAVTDDARAQLLDMSDAQRREVMSWVAVAALMHLGDPDGALAIMGGSDEARIAPALGASEAVVARAVVQLQHGHARDALRLLGDTDELDAGPKAAVSAMRAITAAAAGRPAEARRAATSVLDATLGTFVDRSFAFIALAFAELQDGALARAIAAFEEARALVDATDDRLDQAIVRLARAIALESIGADDAPSARADADAAIARLGGDSLSGWTTAFTLASSPLASAHEMA